MEDETIEVMDQQTSPGSATMTVLLTTLTGFFTAFTKLIQVKSIVTLCLTGAFIWLTCHQMVTEQFLTIYSMIVTFYFVNQASKS